MLIIFGSFDHFFPLTKKQLFRIDSGAGHVPYDPSLAAPSPPPGHGLAPCWSPGALPLRLVGARQSTWPSFTDFHDFAQSVLIYHRSFAKPYDFDQSFVILLRLRISFFAQKLRFSSPFVILTTSMKLSEEKQIANGTRLLVFRSRSFANR